MSPKAYDVVVIGGGVSGLTAAIYLARARKRVLLLEARNRLGGACDTLALGDGFAAPVAAHALYALDPRMVKELRLARHGLKFALRDLALTGLGPGGRHVSFVRDVADTAREIALHSRADAQAWPRFHAELFALARAMRPFWWEAGPKPPQDATLEKLKCLSAAAWLDSWFESDAVKAALAFDAGDGGYSVFEPGSALILLWRAAQEMSGLQGAVALPQGTALGDALAASAKSRGVEIRTGADVARILVDEGRTVGVTLASGETIAASRVLSSLSRRHTLGELAPEAGFDTLAALPSHVNIGEARVILALKSAPVWPGPPSARFVVADRLETYATAWPAARAGKLADELPVEFVMLPGAPPGQALLSARVRPVPVALTDAMKAQIAAKVARLAASVALGAAEVLSQQDIAARTGYDGDSFAFSDWSTRLTTPVAGLFLCGAEPLPCVSGRAARLATHMAAQMAGAA